jgi:hypothetical protein
MTLFGNVAEIDFSKPARPIDRPGYVLDRIIRQPDKEKARTLLGKLERNRFADAGAGTRHDGNLVEKTSGHGDLLETEQAQLSAASRGRIR